MVLAMVAQPPSSSFSPFTTKTLCLCVTHLAPERNPNPNPYARIVPQMWNNGRRDVKFAGFAQVGMEMAEES
jgi:hypothetical protein